MGMKKTQVKNTRVHPPTVLVGVVPKPSQLKDTLEDMVELQRLVEDAGGEVKEVIIQHRSRPDARYFIGKGKAMELADRVKELRAELVVFDEPLRPNQVRNLQTLFNARIIDRVQLILDIFARRARSFEAQLQVEAAQLAYLLPRLTGKGTELSRLGGGIGTRGPGETFLETRQRAVRDRLRFIRKEIKSIQMTREEQKIQRSEAGIAIFALVGYTNAGKSTLFSKLTGVTVSFRDQLFTTLDPKVRRTDFNHNILISDTVGFLHKLPPWLVEAFRATLDVVYEAWGLLHVIDLSSPRLEQEVQTVESILVDMGLKDKPTLKILNKVDKVSDTESITPWRLLWPDSVVASALTGEGLTEILAWMEKILQQYRRGVSFFFPYSALTYVQSLYKHGRVMARRDEPEGIHVVAEVPEWLSEKMRMFRKTP